MPGFWCIAPSSNTAFSLYIMKVQENNYLNCLRAAKTKKVGRLRFFQKVMLKQNPKNLKRETTNLEPMKSCIFTSWSNFLKVFFSAYILKENRKNTHELNIEGKNPKSHIWKDSLWLTSRLSNFLLHSIVKSVSLGLSKTKTTNQTKVVKNR